MKICHALWIALTTASVYSSTCLAEQHWFVSIDGGQATATGLTTDDPNRFYFGTSGVSSLPSSHTNSGISWAVSGGYQILSHLSVQATYLDLGVSNFGYSDSYTAATGINPPVSYTEFHTVDASLSNSGWGIALFGTLPISEYFELHGQLGAMRMSTELTSEIVRHFPGVSYTSSISDSSNSDSGVVGLGAGYRMNGHLTLAIDWRRIFGVGSEKNTIKADYDLVSLGVRLSY
jgi:hypothetical protein